MSLSTDDGTLAELIATQTRRRQHRPLVTAYDDLTGARTELSYATADNWASKTANLLAEECGLDAGAVVTFDLDGHWTTVVLALACWKLGAAVRTVPSAADGVTDLVCAHETRVGDHPDGPLVVVGDGLAAEPAGQVTTRDGVVLLGDEVHAFADDYDSAEVVGSTAALVSATGTWDHLMLLAHADVWHAALGDQPRVGLATGLDDPRALTMLAGVLVAGGSIVADRPPADPPRWDRWATERVTAAAGQGDVLSGAPGGIAVVDLDAV